MRGIRLAGSTACFLARSSSSMFIISISSWFLNSLLARLNSARAFPSWRPSSGSLLGPEDHQRQQKDENHLWHAEIHRFIIMRGGTSSNAGATPL